MVDVIKRWTLSSEQTALLKESLPGASPLPDVVKSLFTQHIQEYVLLHKSLGLPNDREQILSGCYCYYGCLLLAIIHNKEDHKELCSLFTKLYLQVDFYLDSNTKTTVEKQELIKELTLAVATGKSSSLLPPVRTYIELITLKPTAKPQLDAIFFAEVAAAKLENTATSAKSTYLESCYRKGGLTVVAILSLFDIVDTGEGYQVGKCIQLLDDLSDVELDLDSKIHTIATKTLTDEKTLDTLLNTLLQEINIIDNRYAVMKAIMTYIVIYLLHKHPNKYPRLKPAKVDNIFEIVLRTFESLHLTSASNSVCEQTCL